MESFYGGLKGAGMRIVATYPTADDLKEDFTKLDCVVQPGEYAVVLTQYEVNVENNIDSIIYNKYDVQYGNIYLRELDGTATFAGNISGPQGPAAAWTMNGISISNVTKSNYSSSIERNITLAFDGTGGTQSVIGLGTIDNSPSVIISALNNNVTASILKQYPVMLGLPIIYGISDASDALDNINYPNLYFIYDWSVCQWVYGGIFQNINPNNILTIVENTTELDNAAATLYPGGVVLFSTSETVTDITSQQNESYEYNG